MDAVPSARAGLLRLDDLPGEPIHVVLFSTRSNTQGVKPMAMSPRERCATEGIRRSRTVPSALAVPMVAATVWLCAAVLGLAGPSAAHAQGAVTVEPPVAPLAVT